MDEGRPVSNVCVVSWSSIGRDVAIDASSVCMYCRARRITQMLSGVAWSEKMTRAVPDVRDTTSRTACNFRVVARTRLLRTRQDALVDRSTV